ncbi:hypothetical protein THAOC_05612 [Thalassiosira oceanica]|uniref:Uncharacterized protein n=1 Tax=Thalassiosira oceanica TaxID=159749 RepID=K0TMM8_THAOC|nr:hypothetical protein THAOC_05612 [Thalassiosira oceanica]|eukprot:EJK72817.1 hypothetical protein THAOC_05612 [Thalassiosira oceanica]
MAPMNMQQLSGLANMGESSSRPALRRREISLPDVTYCGAIATGDEDGSGGEPAVGNIIPAGRKVDGQYPPTDTDNRPHPLLILQRSTWTAWTGP